MRVGYVLSCGHGLLDFSVHSLLILFTYFSFLMSLWIVCIFYFYFYLFLKFYEILFENHILYEKVISIKIIIIIIIIIIIL